MAANKSVFTRHASGFRAPLPHFQQRKRCKVVVGFFSKAAMFVFHFLKIL
jgi:hypothetical protein